MEQELKQKQIEEMGCMIRVALEYGDFSHLNIHDKDRFLTGRNYIATAENLYNAGYRKIPENAVVLTGDELKLYNENIERDRKKIIDLRLDKHELMNEISEKDNKIALLEETIECIKFNVDFTRKETAEKFAKRLKAVSAVEEIRSPSGNIKIYYIGETELDEICKEIVEGKG